MFQTRKISTRFIAAIVSVLLSCFVVTENAMSQTWSSLNGPQVAKNVKDVTVDNGGTATVYAVDNNYLLKSTNGGTAWRPTSQTVSTPLAVVCKPDNSAYAVTGGTNFLKYTTNGGTGWSDVANTNIINNLTSVRLSVSQITTSTMFLGRNYYSTLSKAFWKSTNSGVDWTRMDNFDANTTVKDIAPYPVHDYGDLGRDDDVWAAGSGTSKGLWKSANGGVNWDAPVLTSYDI